MKRFLLILFILIFLPSNVYAQRGCCSHHGGVLGCSNGGIVICNDGTYSPSCRCAPSVINGCTDRNAKNYNPSANKDNGTCLYFVRGCTDQNALNYNSSAEVSDGTCEYEKIIEEEQIINYNIIENEDASVEYGTSIVSQKGQNGINIKKYKVKVNSSGEELTREFIEEYIKTPSKDEIILKNTTQELKNSDNEFISTLILPIFIISIVVVLICNKKTIIYFSILQLKNKRLKMFLIILYFIYLILPVIDFIYILFLSKKTYKM